ncbi:hypothetical protein BH20ACT10_BH20ACT10_17150 [soil metagenome]
MKNIIISLRMPILLAGAMLFFAACGGGASESFEEGASGEESAMEETTGSADSGGQEYPDILEAELEASEDTYSVDVTVSSPYDSPERYADGWRVLDPDGDILGEHELMHDHASEQPFTRTQTGLEIPDGVEEVTVEGRDLENGYGGETVTVPVEGG